MKNKLIQINGKRYSIPEVLSFPFGGEQGKTCFWECTEFRQPKEGEFYLSGAIPEVYQARGGFYLDYLVVVPTSEAKYFLHTWREGEAIKPRYEHDFSLVFSVKGSYEKDGSDIGPIKMRQAMLSRIASLSEDELIEAIGMPIEV